MGLEVVVALDVCMATGYGKFRVKGDDIALQGYRDWVGDCLDR